MRRKLPLIILSAMLSLIAADASADTAMRLDGMAYEILGDNISNARYDGAEKVVLHPTIVFEGDVYEVYVEADFSDSPNLREITIPEGIQTRGQEFSFRNCPNLKTVHLPASTSAITEGQFFDCPNLDLSSVLTANITSIDAYAFGFDEPTDCGTFNDITAGFNDDTYVDYYAFRNRCYSEVILSNNRQLERLDFQKTENLTVKNLGTGNFGGTLGYSPVIRHLTLTDAPAVSLGWDGWILETLKISGTCGDICIALQQHLTDIDFSGMTGYKFPDDEGITDEVIPTLEINECPLIEKLTLPVFYPSINIASNAALTELSGTDYVRSARVTDCPRIEKLAFPKIETVNYSDISFNDALKEVYFGRTLKEIDVTNFNGCKSLEDLIFGGSIEDWLSIDFICEQTDADETFFLSYVPSLWYGHGDSKLTKLTELNSSHVGNAQRIPAAAFAGYRGLTKVSLPSSVKKICSLAFQKCKNLTDVNINPERIDQFAFFKCTALENITFGSELRYIGPAFSKITTEYTVSFLGTQKQWNAVTLTNAIYLDCENPDKVYGYSLNATPYVTADCKYFYISGSLVLDVVFDKPEVIPGIYRGYRNLRSVTIICGDRYPQIVSNAFSDCPMLESVTYTAPDNDDPDDGFTIGDEAFSFCNKLATIQILDRIKSIGANALLATAWLKAQPKQEVLYFNTTGRGLTAYTYVGTAPENTRLYIKEGTKAINKYAFYSNYSTNVADFENITSISLPPSLKFIGYDAFGSTHIAGDVNIPAAVDTIEQIWLRDIDSFNILASDKPIVVQGIYFYQKARKIGIGREFAPGIGSGIQSGEASDHILFSANVDKITSYIPNAKEITSFAVEPPVCDSYERYDWEQNAMVQYSYVFDFVNFEECTLHVPAGSVEKYRAAIGWNRFLNIVGDATAGIDGIGADDCFGTRTTGRFEIQPGARHYDSLGHEIDPGQRGIHLIVNPDGTRGKILAR